MILGIGRGGKFSHHGRNGCEGELSERGVVLAVDTLTLEDRELNLKYEVSIRLTCSAYIDKLTVC
jgi:hypothetical protein